MLYYPLKNITVQVLLVFDKNSPCRPFIQEYTGKLVFLSRAEKPSYDEIENLVFFNFVFYIFLFVVYVVVKVYLYNCSALYCILNGCKHQHNPTLLTGLYLLLYYVGW